MISFKLLICILACIVTMHSMIIFADGTSLYKKACYSCHDTGLVNAPRLGDKQQWLARQSKGINKLSQSVINGKGAMPPRGGTRYSDKQIKQVIKFMLSKLK